MDLEFKDLPSNPDKIDTLEDLLGVDGNSEILHTLNYWDIGVAKEFLEDVEKGLEEGDIAEKYKEHLPPA